MTSQPEGLLPGIYFDLDEEVYHKDPSLSHTGMKNILIHPHHYWHYSSLNPNWKQKRTDAMDFGKMSHMLLMQPEIFFKEYNVPGMGYVPGKKIVSRTDYDKVQESVQMIKDVPDAYRYFSNGYPEVSIIVTDPETGIRMRCRVDWLRVFGFIDLKRSKEIENNPLGWVIAEHAYDIQFALYKRCILLVKELLRKGNAHIHNCPDKKWLDKFKNDKDCEAIFFFQRSTSPYVFRILQFDDEILQNAYFRMGQALSIYKEHITKYGTNKWPAGKPEIEEFSIYHLPRKIFDQGT